MSETLATVRRSAGPRRSPLPPTRSSPTRRSRRASASTPTGSCSAPASASGASARRTARLADLAARAARRGARRRRRRRRRARPRARRHDDRRRGDARRRAAGRRMHRRHERRRDRRRRRLHRLPRRRSRSALGAARVRPRASACCSSAPSMLSRYTDPDDRRTAALFGDGAGALLLGPGRAGGSARSCCAPTRDRDLLFATRERGAHRDGGPRGLPPRRRADGRGDARGVPRPPARRSTTSTSSSSTRPTAASSTRSAQRLGSTPSASSTASREYGNTSAASIPLALDDARRDGRLHRRRARAAGAFGAGFTWGARGRGLGTRMRRLRHSSPAARAASAPPSPRALAADGWPVAVNYRSRRRGGRGGRRVEPPAAGVAVHADVTDPAAADALFAQPRRSSAARCSCSSTTPASPRDDLRSSLSDDDWDRVVDTNLCGAFRLTRRALRPMIRARFGRIVNVASVVGPRANAGQANYAAAKAGLIGLTKTVAAEVARRGVTVNAVAPGLHRDRHDRRACATAASSTSPRAARARPRRSPPACASSPPRTPATSPEPRSTVDGGLTA